MHLSQVFEHRFPPLIHNFGGQQGQPFAAPRVVPDAGGGRVVEVNICELLVAQDAGDEAANALDRNIIIRYIEIYEKRTRVQMLNERGNMLHLQVIA